MHSGLCCLIGSDDDWIIGKFPVSPTNLTPIKPSSRYQTSEKLHAQFLKDVRARVKELGITQAELGKRLGLKQQHVSRLLSGKHCPSLETVARIAKSLDCVATLNLLEK